MTRASTHNEDELARRHAKVMLVTPGVFIGLLLLAHLCWPAGDMPGWVGICAFIVSGLLPLAMGPRYVGVLLLVDAAALTAVALTKHATAEASWFATVVLGTSIFAIALWPMFEQQYVLQKRNILGSWAALLGMFVVCILGFAFDGLSLRAAYGVRVFYWGGCLVGLLLLLQSCQHAWAILRGPRVAELSPRGFPISSDGTADQQEQAAAWGKGKQGVEKR